MRLVLIRPSLTIVIGMLVLTLALSSYSRAKKEACHLALKIHATCVKDMQCPESLDGTGVEVGKLSGKPVVGGWVKYPFQYRLTKQGFIGYVYQSLDMGGNIVGNYTGELSWESGKHCVGI